MEIIDRVPEELLRGKQFHCGPIEKESRGVTLRIEGEEIIGYCPMLSGRGCVCTMNWDGGEMNIRGCIWKFPEIRPYQSMKR